MGLERTGQSIASLRKKAGLTQRELADYLGISDKAVSKWERGITFPDISFLTKLSVLLDTDADSLLEGTPAHNDEWTGILIPGRREDKASPGIDTIIYDKPMICYLLSSFMLAGIRSIHVHCSDEEKDYMLGELGQGDNLGISLNYCTDKKYTLPDTGIMLVSGKRLLFGRGLTRCLKLAMTHKDRFTVLSLVKKEDSESKRIDFDPTMKITRIGRIRKNHAHCFIPFMFIPRGMNDIAIPSEPEDFDDMLVNLAGKNLLYTEILDRGFIEFGLDTWEMISDASLFVRLVQERSGMSLCSLDEIARRRGFIPE